MSDQITRRDRKLIDAAVAAGRIRKIPAGASSYAAAYDPATSRIVLTEQPNFRFGPRQRAHPDIAKRRAKVCVLVLDGATIGEVAKRLRFSPATISQDIAALKADGRLDRKGPKP